MFATHYVFATDFCYIASGNEKGMVRIWLLSFGKYAEDAQPEVLVTLIQSFVERIYIVDENDERYCHIFIKGCMKEDYEEFFRATGYISDTNESSAITSKLSLCDSDKCCKYDVIFAIPFCVC